jgi:Protein of unknown function (DUF3822)
LHAIKEVPVKKLFQIPAAENSEMVQPVLSIRAGERHCCFSITEFGSDELIQLAYYSSDEVNEDFFKELIHAHPELAASFYQVLICYDYPQSSLVSFKEYKQGEGSLLLNILFGLNGKASVISEPVNGWQLYNIYAVPENVHSFLTKKFTTAKYWHQYTLTIKNSQYAENGKLRIDLRKNDFTLLAMASNKILLVQTIDYATPDDVLYFLLRVCNQFGLSQQEVQVELSGLVDQQSALYRQLYQYFLHLDFKYTSWKVAAVVPNENPDHFFTSLNDLSACAS